MTEHQLSDINIPRLEELSESELITLVQKIHAGLNKLTRKSPVTILGIQDCQFNGDLQTAIASLKASAPTSGKPQLQYQEVLTPRISLVNQVHRGLRWVYLSLVRHPDAVPPGLNIGLELMCIQVSTPADQLTVSEWCHESFCW